MICALVAIISFLLGVPAGILLSVVTEVWYDNRRSKEGSGNMHNR